MSTPRVRFTSALASVLLVMVLAVTVVSARPPAQEEVSENLEQLAQIVPASARVSDVVGDDPDEPGYTGEQITPLQAISVTSESAATGGADWEALMAGPQPDKTGNAEGKAPEWSDFYYKFLAGSALRPRDSSSGWRYEGVGCVYRSNGSELFTINLDIPNGARIDYLRLFYRDTSASNGTAWITNYDGAGNFTDLTSVSSAGNGGYGTTLSPQLSHVVDTAARSYVVNWEPAQNGNTMQLCGVRVAYRLPN